MAGLIANTAIIFSLMMPGDTLDLELSKPVPNMPKYAISPTPMSVVLENALKRIAGFGVPLIIRPGMTAEQVITILGRPDGLIGFFNSTYFYYDSFAVVVAFQDGIDGGKPTSRVTEVKRTHEPN